MNPADLLVAALIVIILASAIFVLVREKRSGRKCCGCKSCCEEPRIIRITDEPEKRERRQPLCKGT